MPIGVLHKKKRVKNFVLLALILGWVAMIWVIAMVRMAQAGALDDVFMDQRQIHQQEMEADPASWDKDWRAGEPERQNALQEQDARRARHLQDLISTAKDRSGTPVNRTP